MVAANSRAPTRRPVGLDTIVHRRYLDIRADAQYLLKSLQGFQKKGITAHAISIQVSVQQKDFAHLVQLVVAE